MANLEIQPLIEIPPLTKKELAEKLKDYADGSIELAWTAHAKERLQERNIMMSDVLYLLRHHTLQEVQKTTRTDEGLYKYVICGTVNSTGIARKICVVLLPSNTQSAVKVITVFEEDEENKKG